MKDFLVGIMIGYIVGLIVMTSIFVLNHNCTVTITDMQGVHHVIKGERR